MEHEEYRRRFHDFAYGMFIHYGLYTIHARGEWVMSKERMTDEEYFKVLPQFKNNGELAEKWVETAARCGMRYACLTTRHHDGYFIGSELVGSFCNACRKHGLGVGLYYSVGDWSDRDFRGGAEGKNWGRFVEKTHRQLRELMSDYGRIDYLFYDGCPDPHNWDAKNLHGELRKLQPGLLISCRCGLDEDIASSEGHTGTHPGTWESCYTLNDHWGYNQYDRNWKSPEEIITLLMTLRHNNGNLLLNIGPMPDGSIQPEELRRLETVGRWLSHNGEAVYEVTPHPFNYKDQEISTGHGSTVYIMLQADYLGPRRIICGIGNRIRKITLLEDRSDIAFRQEADKVYLTGLSFGKEGGLPRVLKIDLDSAPFGIHNPMWPENNFRVC